MSAAVDAIDLDGIVLLDASAGTGKTWTLAALFLRAVILHRLRVPQIVMVTFTEAATRELQQRVRQWLQQAAELAGHADAVDDANDDAPQVVPQAPADSALLRHWLRQARQRGESRVALHQRLQRAVRELDQAAISTIHGFCQRLLRDHALHAARPLLAAELEPPSARQRLQLATALWRQWAGDADAAAFLQHRFGSVDGRNGLAAAIPALLAPEPMLPSPPAQMPPDPRPALQQAWQALQHTFHAHGAATRGRLLQAIAAKQLHNGQYKAEHVEGLWAWLQHATTASPDVPHPKLGKYRPDAVTAGRSAAAVKAGEQIASPLFAAMDDWWQALGRVHAWQAAREVQQLHALRQAVVALDQSLKQRRNCMDFDDLIAQAHAAVTDPWHGPALVQAVRGQFALAFVDEFQDTDARQWAIVHGLFGAGGLVLVGDAKQAIYRFRGGDVHTWLTARAQADAVHVLDRNFRARPVLLQAIATLYRYASDADMGPGIAFQPVQPGGNRRDADWLCDGRPAAALHWHCLPDPPVVAEGKQPDWSADDSLSLAARACAHAVAGVLQQARDGRLQLRVDEGHHAVAPHDCAVLVRDNRQAVAMRRALADCGVAAVASARASLFSGTPAQDVLALLLALQHPADTGRLRALLATPLFGLDAPAIAVLRDGSSALDGWQQRADDWRQLWQRHGPHAVLAQLAAERACRRQPSAEGERHLAHWLQLGEQLQQVSRQRPGLAGQIAWLQRAIATADPFDASQQPRLESDAGRVRILTVHKSKGLEFPLVFLPFAGIGRGRGVVSNPVTYAADDGIRVQQWNSVHVDAASPDWAGAVQRQQRDEREEAMRLLYVALTRARHGLWLCSGRLSGHRDSALGRLLGGAQPDATLRQALGESVHWQSGLPESPSLPLPSPPLHLPSARQPQRVLRHDWRIHSFSRLHQPLATAAALPEPAPAEDDWQPSPLQGSAIVAADPDRFSGTRFGNALHHALEHADFAAWSDTHADRLAPDQANLLQAALRANGYGDADHAAGVPLLADLVARTLQSPLPEGLRLCDLPVSERIAELEFHFTVHDASTAGLLALLQQAGWMRHRTRLGAAASLQGLMNGKIDLVYRHADRLYLLDYKSNRLPDYRQQTLERAMDAADYGLQALLYAVALHRWQRQRRDDYVLERHFGGARYLFCRGLSPQQPMAGMACPAVTTELILAADALLGSAAEPSA